MIAYLVPGFVVLWGLGTLSPEVYAWLAGPKGAGPTIGGFLYVTIASVSAGMTASAVRWAIIDTIHHLTGLTRPVWSDAQLAERMAAYDWLVENHYRYYQFYSNSLVAMLFSYACWRGHEPASWWLDVLVLLLAGVFAAGSRNALERYYARAQSLLNTHPQEKSHDQRRPPQAPRETR